MKRNFARQIIKPVRKFWKKIEWPGIIFLGFLSILLGIIGFQKYFVLMGTKVDFLDLFYRSLQLFPLNSGGVAPIPGVPLPWELELSRYLAPLTSAYTVFQAAMNLFKNQIDLWRLKNASGHVVICGLGSKGLLLANEFKKEFDLVAVIELERDNPQLGSCRENDVVVLLGDARDPAVLARAGVKHASVLISVCGDDGTNAEIAEAARIISVGRKGQVLKCFIHVIDPKLWIMLRHRELSMDEPGFELEFFNVYESGARLLYREHPPFLDNNYSEGQIPHLLIIYMGWFAESLIVHAAQEWAKHFKNTGIKLFITIIDPEIDQWMQGFMRRYPIVSSVCTLNWIRLDLRSPELNDSDYLFSSQKQEMISSIYICTDDSSLGFGCGLSLVSQLHNQKMEIMVQMSEDSGLTNLLNMTERPSEIHPKIFAFGLLERVCKPGLLEDGTHETLARAIHSTYLETVRAAGVDPRGNQFLAEWDALTEELKESNRRQANHISEKLTQINCGISPWVDYEAIDFSFSPLEIERLGQLEHERWVSEKKDQGWQYGPGRNDREKIHPDLVDWNDPRLSEAAKEKNRQTISQIPTYLAKAGFQISRW